MAPKRQGTSTSTTPMTSSTKLSSGPPTLKANSSAKEIAQHVWQQYLATTPQRTLLLDVFMGFLVLIGGIQFLYCIVAGNYPFNAFLSGFCASVGQFVLTASLRMQTNTSSSAGNADKSGGSSSSKGKSLASESEQADDSPGISHERAFADFVFGSVILHFFCVNFIN